MKIIKLGKVYSDRHGLTKKHKTFSMNTRSKQTHFVPQQATI